MPYRRIGKSRRTSVLMRDVPRRAPFLKLFPWIKTYPSETTYPGPGVSI